jgi:hypothetical protein
MFKPSVIAPALLALSLFAAAPAFAAGGDASIHEVYQDAEAGRFSDAQAKMDKVLQDHPNSAKAHYVEADLLAKQGKLRDAQIELNTAQRLDPSLSFAKPAAVRELQDVISGSHVVSQRSPAFVQHQVVQQPASSTSGWILPVIVIAIIALIFMARMLMRRPTVVVGGPGYNNGYGPSYGPSYGGGGPGMVVGQGGGLGSGILGGLATGAAVGAGIVAGEELMHHFTDGDRDREREREVYRDTPPQDDMGGNDFGVSDSSSWDSGGGGGSDDW